MGKRVKWPDPADYGFTLNKVEHTCKDLFGEPYEPRWTCVIRINGTPSLCKLGRPHGKWRLVWLNNDKIKGTNRDLETLLDLFEKHLLTNYWGYGMLELPWKKAEAVEQPKVPTKRYAKPRYEDPCLIGFKLISGDGEPEWEYPCNHYGYTVLLRRKHGKWRLVALQENKDKEQVEVLVVTEHRLGKLMAAFYARWSKLVVGEYAKLCLSEEQLGTMKKAGIIPDLQPNKDIGPSKILKAAAPRQEPAKPVKKQREWEDPTVYGFVPQKAKSVDAFGWAGSPKWILQLTPSLMLKLGRPKGRWRLAMLAGRAQTESFAAVSKKSLEHVFEVFCGKLCASMRSVFQGTLDKAQAVPKIDEKMLETNRQLDLLRGACHKFIQALVRIL